MLTRKSVFTALTTLLVLLVVTAGIYILIDQILRSDHDLPGCCAEIPSVEEYARYSSAEAAAMVRDKLSDRESSLSTLPCLTHVSHYTSGYWLPEERAHLLKFGDLEVKYFETSGTMLTVEPVKPTSFYTGCF